MKAWAQSSGYWCETFSRHLADEAFSPQYVRPSDWLGRLEDKIGQGVLAQLTGGTHLVAVFKSKGEAQLCDFQKLVDILQSARMKLEMGLGEEFTE